MQSFIDHSEVLRNSSGICCKKFAGAFIYTPNILLMPVVGWACFFLLISFKISFSQIDTEFWFVAPEVTTGHGDMPIVLRITSFETAANVTISQPANSNFREISFRMPANSSQTVDLTSNLHNIENRPAFTKLNRGILIESDQPITAYYEVNNEVNPDIFSLKGRNALGKEFIIPAQNFWDNSDVYDPPPLSSFDIVATEDNTNVAISLSRPVFGHTTGSTIEIELDRGETFSVEKQDRFAISQLTGTYIKADRLIAITLKDDSNVHSGCHDLGGDQLVPIDVLGTEYVVVKGFLSPNDKVFIMATQDQTSITVNGIDRKSLDLNRGEMDYFDLVDKAVYIQSSKPIYVLHATGFGCEVGQAIVPKLECTGSRSVSFTRSTDEFFGAIVITNTSYTAGFLLNGDNSILSAQNFDTIPGTKGRYSAARIDLTSQSQAGTGFRIENTVGSFHLGIINGDNFTGCRYGYFSDFKTLKILAANSKICYGNSLRLEASGTDKYFWRGDPIIEGTQLPEITVTPDTTILYSVIGSDASLGCLDTAELKVEVFDWPIPAVEISKSCIHEPTIFQYTGEEELAYIEWIFDEKDTFRTNWHVELQVEFVETGSKHLRVRAFNPAGCLSETNFQFTTGGFDIGLDSFYSVTRGQSVRLKPTMNKGNLTSATIRWLPPTGLECTSCFVTSASPYDETHYNLQLTDSMGCSASYQTHIYVNDPVFIPNAFSPNGDGINDTFRLYAKGIHLESVQIYDRWGRLQFQSDQSGMEWDGYFQDKVAPPGVYIYHFSGKHLGSQTPFEFSGDVTLIR